MITETDKVVHDGLQTTLKISVPLQRMEVISDGKVTARYPVSTSKFGEGSEPGSYKTPTGKFRDRKSVV